MSAEFRQMPPAFIGVGGAGEEFGLVEWAERYRATQPESFGGAWLDDNEQPQAYASFVGDLEPHRAALDPRIRIVAADHSATALSKVSESVKAMAHARPSVRLGPPSVHADRGVVVVTAEADDEAAFEEAVRARFGDVVDLYFERYGRVDTDFEDWSIDSSGTTITVQWTGGSLDREQGVDAVEEATTVHLTAWAVTHVDYRRAAGSKGRSVAGLTRSRAIEGKRR